MSTVAYKRILLKLSGEAMQGKDNILDFDFVTRVAETIKKAVAEGVEVSVVIGGGNIWRGRQSGKMDRTRADHMGMIATAINSIALQDTLIACGVDAKVLSALKIEPFAEYYSKDLAVKYLSEGKVVIFCCGTGSPYFSTDTGAVLRAAQIEADALLFAKNIDGVYTADPNKDPNAVRYTQLTYAEALAKNLKATDITAMALAMDNNMTMVCFGLDQENSIIRVVRGEKIGTTVTN